MQCRTCQAEMPRGATVCPVCQTPVTPDSGPSEYYAAPVENPYSEAGPSLNPYGAPYNPYAATPLAPPPSGKKSRTGLIVAIVVIAVLVLGGCGVGCSFMAYGLGNLTNQAVSKQNEQATQTARAQAVYDDATSGKPDFVNALAGKEDGKWIQSGTGSNYGCAFQQGSFHVYIEQAKLMEACAFSAPYADFALEIKVNIVKGDYAGLAFRANDDMSNYYLLQYNQKGEYALIRTDTKGGDGKYLIANTTSSRFSTNYGNDNTITLIAKGNTFYLYANHSILGQATDTTYTSGKIALTALDTTQSTEVAFSQAKIWKL